MQISSFRYLIELEQSGSINKAASRLFISQQGLSKVIGSLEDELGLTLLTRTHDGIEFTDEGFVVLESAKRLVDEYDCMIERASETLTARVSQPFNLVISPYASINLYDSVLAKVKQPDSMSLIEVRKEKILASLNGNNEHAKPDDDLYLFDWVSESAKGLPQIQINQHFALEPVLQTMLGLMCSPDAAHAGQGSITADQALDIPLVCLNEKDYLQAIDVAMGLPNSGKIVMSNSNQKAIESYILKEPAASVILDEFSYTHRSQKLRDYRFVPFAQKPTLTVAFAYRKDSSRLLQFKRFIDRCRKACR